jgi:hypothetical protein
VEWHESIPIPKSVFKSGRTKTRTWDLSLIRAAL